ncbi:MAG: phosphoesterase [Clostridia bacterium]|nr:phosphoesterase [Clostridia bacterium]
MTERLYYDQPYLTSFDAVVTDARPHGSGCAVSLDRSAFYPTSGGQPFDTGALNGLPVTDVFVDEAGEVWHSVEGALSPGDAVRGEIDWARRFDHMQQHAGEHMIAGSVWRQFGGTTIGLHLGAAFSTIDVTMPHGETHLTPDQIRAVEDDVNGEIQRDVPIRCWFPDEAELAALPLRKPPTVKEHVRVVAIGEREMVACGGTHPSSAGQIGLVKIIDARPSKGKTRLAFVCGMRAVRDYREKYDACTRAAALLSAQPAQLPKAVTRLNDAVAALEHEISQLRQAEALAQAPAIRERAEVIGGYRVAAAKLGPLAMDGLRRLATELTRDEGAVALIAAEREGGYSLVFARGAAVNLDMGRLLREAASRCGGKGGGKPDFAQGSSPDAAALDAAKDMLRGM